MTLKRISGPLFRLCSYHSLLYDRKNNIYKIKVLERSYETVYLHSHMKISRRLYHIYIVMSFRINPRVRTNKCFEGSPN